MKVWQQSIPSKALGTVEHRVCRGTATANPAYSLQVISMTPLIKEAIRRRAPVTLLDAHVSRPRLMWLS